MVGSFILPKVPREGNLAAHPEFKPLREKKWTCLGSSSKLQARETPIITRASTQEWQVSWVLSIRTCWTLSLRLWPRQPNRRMPPLGCRGWHTIWSEWKWEPIARWTSRSLTNNNRRKLGVETAQDPNSIARSELWAIKQAETETILKIFLKRAWMSWRHKACFLNPLISIAYRTPSSLPPMSQKWGWQAI